MAKEYKVMANSMAATYRAGRHIADNKAEACKKARMEYAKSPVGRAIKDVGAFRFYVVAEWPDQ